MALEEKFNTALLMKDLAELLPGRNPSSHTPGILKVGKPTTFADLVQIFQRLGAKRPVEFKICFRITEIELGKPDYRIGSVVEVKMVRRRLI
jgi:hypothetical protein